MISVRLGACLGATAAALILPSAALAQSENRLSVDASVTAGYANNPFTIQGSDTGSGVVTIDVAPYYQRTTSRSMITVSADVNVQQYLRRYGDNESYSGALDYRGRPSERLNTHARLDLSSSVLGASGGYVPITAGTGIGVVGDTTGTAATAIGATSIATPASALVPFTDIGLFGLRNRRRTARLSGDAGLTLSARDTLNVSGYGEVTRYANLRAGDYEAYGGTVGYSRRVSDRLTAGFQGSGAIYNYQTGIANTRVYSIQATGTDKLSDRWTVDGALGVSFVNSDTALSTRSTSLSGNINLCRLGQLSTLCVQAARQVSPTGLAGSQYVTTAGLNWSKRLGEQDSASLGITYSTVGGNTTRLIAGALPLQTQYAQAFAGYNRRLRDRLQLIASVNYRQLLGGGNVGRPKDFGGQIGLSYQIGNKR